MDDLISRAQAIDALETVKTVKAENGELYIAKINAQMKLGILPSVQPDDDRLERCRFEYVNACKILAHRTPDTRKKDIDDAYAVVRTLNPIFGEESF